MNLSVRRRLGRVESKLNIQVGEYEKQLEDAVNLYCQRMPDVSREEAIELVALFIGKTREQGAEIAVSELMRKANLSREDAIKTMKPYIIELETLL